MSVHIRIGNFVHTNNINISIVCVDKDMVDGILLVMCQHCAKQLGVMIAGSLLA